MSQHDRYNKVPGVERLESRCVLSASGLFGGMHGPAHGPHDRPGGRDFGGQHFGPAGDFGGPRDGRFDGGRHGGPRGHEPPPPPAFRPDSFVQTASVSLPSVTIIVTVPAPQQPVIHSEANRPPVPNRLPADEWFGSLVSSNSGDGGWQASALTSLISFEEQAPSAARLTGDTLRLLPSSSADDETTAESGQDKPDFAPAAKTLRPAADGKAKAETDGLIELDPEDSALRHKTKAGKAAPVKVDTSALVQLLRELPLRVVPQLASDSVRLLRDPPVQTNDSPQDSGWIELLAADVNSLATQRPAVPAQAAVVHTARPLDFEANVALYQAQELATEPELAAEAVAAADTRAGQLAQTVAEPMPAN